jgi:hypothetical protein
MANQCVFCGDQSAALTAEHVFPDWITGFYKGRVGKLPLGTVEMGTAGGPMKEFRTVPFQQKARIVCHACNHGWMSDLEARLKPYLSRMLVGRPTHLPTGVQRDLARWCVKTAMVMEYLNPRDPLIPRAHYRDLYNSSTALPCNFVVISSREIPVHEKDLQIMQSMRDRVLFGGIVGGDQRTVQEQVSKWVRNGHGAYKVTFAVGNFVAQVFGHDFPSDIRIAGPGPAMPIWPEVGNQLNWSMDKVCVDMSGGLVPFHRMFAAPPPKVSVPPDYFTRVVPFRFDAANLIERGKGAS